MQERAGCSPPVRRSACADSIPAESALGTHVHVQVTQNDAPIDVLTLLDEDEPE